MSVGVLAHLFGSLSCHELAAKVSSYGFNHVQLALWKAIRDVDFQRAGLLSPGLAMSIGEEFNKQGVHISILGCYLHFFDHDVEQRNRNIKRCKELLRYARFMGAPMVAFETGAFQDYQYTDQDWAVMKQVLIELAEEAVKWGVFVGLEAAHGHLVGNAQQLDHMLAEVSSSQIGVVLDPGNLLHQHNYVQQNEVIREAFHLIGERVIACHAKDFKIGDDGKFKVVPPGQGEMNYELYMELIQQYKPGVHIIMEEASELEMPAS